jgi:uncharacterized membrane protein
MQHTGSVLSLSPLPYLAAMLNPPVFIGILALIGSVLVRMALLSVADLSYVLPLTALGYVISAALGWVVLREPMELIHVAGTVLIVLGATLVSSTAKDTTST